MKTPAIVKNYFDHIKPPYKRSNIPSIFATLLLLTSSPVLIMSSRENKPKRSYVKAAMDQVDDEELRIKTDSVLVKLRGNNPQERGNSQADLKRSLNQLSEELGIGMKDITPVINRGQNTPTDAEIHSWYRLELNSANEVAVANIKRVKDRFDSDHPAVAHLAQVLNRLEQNENVEAAEPEYIAHLLAVPNDPYYSSTGSWGQSYDDMWGLKTSGLEGAWDVSTGSAEVIVAVVDTGLDTDLPDIANNLWSNNGEVAGNGVDDDGNGYIDDVNGWNFDLNTNNVQDSHGHGTHVSGTIGAVGNNGNGVVGVNWNVRIMPLKFIGASGYGTHSGGASSIIYAANNGADVISNSWGCECYSQITQDAVDYAHSLGAVVVSAAGNDNRDAIDHAPAMYHTTMTIAAYDPDLSKASFSNWGPKIDVSAPGVDVLSLRSSTSSMCDSLRTVDTYYCRVSGTSMATPHVSGLAALLLSANPDLTNEQVRQIIRMSAVDLGAQGVDDYFGYGRIDGSAMNQTAPLAPFISSPKTRESLATGTIDITGSIVGDNFSSYKLEYGVGRKPSSWTLINSSNVQVADGILGSIDTLTLNDQQGYTFKLTATDTSGNNFEHKVFDVSVNHIDNAEVDLFFPHGMVSQANHDLIATVQTDLTLSAYTVEWGQGTNPTTWSSEGVSLANGGIQQVTQDVVATWDTTQRSPGVYTIRITLNTEQGTSYSEKFQLTVDKDMVPGWPKMMLNRPNNSGTARSIPVIADLDGDGTEEIISTELVGRLQVFNKDGSNFPGFPVDLNSNYAPVGTVSVFDLDGNGTKEIVGLNGMEVYIINHDGTNFEGWPKRLFSSASSPASYDRTPVLTDLNNDGAVELFYFEREGFDSSAREATFSIHAVQLDGTEIEGYPRTLTFGDSPSYPDYYTTPSVKDLNGDGTAEIAWGFGRRFYLFDNQMNLLPGWPFIGPISSTVNEGIDGYENHFRDGQSFADLNGDGVYEIVAQARLENLLCIGCKYPVFAFNLDGTTFGNWPKYASHIPNNSSPYNTPSAVDIDGNGSDEVAVSLTNIHVYDAANEIMLYPHTSTGGGGGSQVAVRDVNGDGVIELVNSYGDQLDVINTNGSVVWERTFPEDGRNIFDPSVVSDIDNNGLADVVTIRRSRFTVDDYMALYLWEIPETPAQTSKDWQMYNHDTQRSGNLAHIMAALEDIDPPTAPSNLQAAQVTFSQADLVWNPSTDNIAVSEYVIYRDGSEIGRSTVTSFSDVTVTSGYNYTYHVTAVDARNNESDPSNTLDISVPVDSPPSAPANLQTTNVTYSQVDLAWQGSTDDIGVSEYVIYRNNTVIARTDATTYADATVNSNTSYNYYVTAVDTNNNESDPSNTVSVQTPNTPQPTQTSITGVVTSSVDQTAVVGATITLIDPQQRGKKAELATASTNDVGDYILLPDPGTYDVEVSADGFEKQVAQGVQVSDGEVVTIDFSLNVSVKGNKSKDSGGSGGPPDKSGPPGKNK